MRPARALPVAVLLFALSACAAKADVARHANQALATALASVNATQAAFVAWDADRQAQIVAAATSEEGGRAALQAYRARRALVVRAFVATYSAIMTASSTLALLESGQDPGVIAARLRDVGSAILDLRAAVAALGSD